MNTTTLVTLTGATVAIEAPTTLPTFWALILLAAVVISLIFGLLTYLQTKGSWPAALLAAFGAAVLGLHQILGP